MATEKTHRSLSDDLSREEQWVIHHALLERIEMELHAPGNADPPSLTVYRAFEKLEGDARRFSTCERRCVRGELRMYAARDDVPDRDATAAESALERLRERSAAVA